ncbi:MAG: UDP-N-acetylmuramoyl-L-alanine--D-glutamate ligase [Phycisphaerales bacterium]
MAAPSLANRRVTVMGIGRFGGGLGAIEHLLGLGARVLATDRLDAESLGETHDRLQRLAAGEGHLELRLGEHEPRDFRGADLVVANPAIPAPWNHPCLQAARDAGVPITTEIRIAIDALPGRRFVGVTGSVGKSSTAAMLHHGLQRMGIPTALGGNIGGSLLGQLDRVPSDAWVVLELSSFMLHWLAEDARPWSPDLAVLTTIRPNHLDWHLDLDHYVRSKAAIVGGDGRAPLVTAFEAEDPDAAREAAKVGGPWWRDPADRFAPTLAEIDPDAIDLAIPGEHQRRNARLALAAILAIHAIDGRAAPGQARLLESLADFRGLPHRLADVGERSKTAIRYIDDSKSTTPEATCLAVDSLGDRSRVHLIAGGHDKGADLDSIAALTPSLAGLYAIGTTATRLAQHPDAILSGTLQQAFADLRPRLRDGDIVLLSPGCASWDQFRDYRERGEIFARFAGASSADVEDSSLDVDATTDQS